MVRHYLNLVKYNARIIGDLNIVAAAAIALLTPVVFNLEFLNYREAASIGEMYLAAIGIILFPYLVGIEKRANVQDIVFVKKTNPAIILIIRLVLAALTALLLIGGVLYWASLQHGQFPFLEIWLGTCVSAVYLGLIGLTIVNYTGNIVAGYLVAFAYYIFEIISAGQISQRLYPLSLLKYSFAEKCNILPVLALLTVLNLSRFFKK